MEYVKADVGILPMMKAIDLIVLCLGLGPFPLRKGIEGYERTDYGHCCINGAAAAATFSYKHSI